MKISNSKKQLAEIIHENGGWRDGAEFAAQDSVKDSRPCRICFYSNKPKLKTGARRWFDGNNGIVGGAEGCIHGVNAISNWHQTRLSRDEYFHLYPAPVKVVVENKTTCHLTVADKPTIEQLAADYRNAKDYAERRQQEADAAKADVEAKLAALVAAGKAIGLVLGVAGPEPELVITDWRDLLEGDVVWYGGDDELSPGEYHVMEIETQYYEGYLTVLVNGSDGGHWVDTRAGWSFIRRPITTRCLK